MLSRYPAAIILAILGTHAARADRVMVPAASFGMGCSAGDPACEADESEAGGRLPTEPEWERAARAGSSSRYPWGQEVSCAEAILDEVSPAASKQEPDGCYGAPARGTRGIMG